jgi:hypothetical protein
MKRANRRKRRLVLTGAFLAGFGAGMAPLASALGDGRVNIGGTAVQTSARPEPAQGRGHTPDGIANSAGAFERLSPNDKTIARALMDSETLTKPGAVAWSLDRIAAERQSASSWAEVFGMMQTEGVLRARSLKQVTAAYLGRAPVSIGSDLVITTAGGDHIPVDTHSTPAAGGAARDGDRLAAGRSDEAARIAAELGDATETEEMAPASGPDAGGPHAGPPDVGRPHVSGPDVGGSDWREAPDRARGAESPERRRGSGSADPAGNDVGLY